MDSDPRANQFIVIAVDSRGHLAPADTPFIHYDEESAKRECERLARQSPGVRFTFWQNRGSCIKHDVDWDIPQLAGLSGMPLRRV